MSFCRFIILTLVAIVLLDQCSYASYINTDVQGTSSQRDVQDHGYFRRARSACIERRSNCDHDPESCCEPTVCRCNLWGANCRCARAGIF